MARTKYVTTQVEEQTYQSILDAANLWGESMSKATDRLVQRGLIALDAELGSKTPTHIEVMRIHHALTNQMSTKQRLTEGYRLAGELKDTETMEEIKALADELGINLT